MAEYIEREAILRKIERREKFMVGDKTITTDAMKLFIENRQVADVALVVHGRWLDGRCTVCGWEEPDEVGYDGYEFSPWEHTNYCPNCGAKMDGGESNEAD